MRAHAGDRASPAVQLVGFAPEGLKLSAGEVFRLLEEGRLREIRLGRGRRTSERAVGKLVR
ncbi:hypothetical protein [Streptomyces sp. NPDC051079]|uniref:hypothetical protein n=1 Tax=Streptomyces sp. NPDC051079 TaxID=3155043 RepID=UPI00344B99B9